MTTPLHIVILAAGKGTRMKSELPKVLHHVGGEPMIGHVLKTGAVFNPASTTVVVGHMAEKMRAALEAWPMPSPGQKVQSVIQEPQLGTAHALLQAEPVLRGATGTVVLLYGDVPLLEREALRGLIDHHRSTGAALTALSASVDRPKGYGRIIRDAEGSFLRIVEERDATDEERAIAEINAGVYAFELDGLFDSLRLIATGNSQAEYYLPDLVAIYRQQGRRVEAHEISGDPQQLLGVNSREELARMNAILRDKRNQAIMASGVTLIDPATTWIGADVAIGQDTVVHPNTYLEGATRIGANCEIHAGTRIVDSTLADNVIVQNCCVIRNSTVGAGATLGPFAHIRPDSVIGDQVHIGNFVELKKATLGTGTKAGHLAYLGDATIGADVNIGAGVITCNYDGAKKYQTIIEDGVFVGTDSQLVAPVTVGKGAYVAAGSSITENVPAGALGIGRGKQVNKEGWADARRKRRETEKAQKAEKEAAAKK
jgi:bifunctional UDP-N-acetylglucosamine pyrophosphorylase / glucosamine-1-phosphate N-acetyltransferase